MERQKIFDFGLMKTLPETVLPGDNYFWVGHCMADCSSEGPQGCRSQENTVDLCPTPDPPQQVAPAQICLPRKSSSRGCLDQCRYPQRVSCSTPRRSLKRVHSF